MAANLQETYQLAATAASMARGANEKANLAIDKSDTAISGLREIHEDMGGFATELAACRGGIQSLSDRFSSLERLVKEALAKLGAGVVQAKAAARKSHRELEEVREDFEDSKVTMMRQELVNAKKRLDSLRVRDKAIVGWVWKVVAGVAIVVIGALLVWKLGIKH